MWNAYQEARKGVEHTEPKFWILGVHGLGDMRWPIGYPLWVEGASSKAVLSTQDALDIGG